LLRVGPVAPALLEFLCEANFAIPAYRSAQESVAAYVTKATRKSGYWD